MSAHSPQSLIRCLLGLVLLALLAQACASRSLSLPQPWPPRPLTDEQIKDVRQCALNKLPPERYPENLTTPQLANAYQPKTGCDWAVLAAAYVSRFEGDHPQVPQSAKDAFIKAYQANPGFAFVPVLVYGYSDDVPLVEAPPWSKQAITDLEMTYAWSGLGNDVSYSVIIGQADSTPVLSGEIQTRELGDAPSATRVVSGTVDTTLVQALAGTLTDLLPIDNQFTMMPCVDNYPNWKVKLQFADGKELILTTKQSNYLFMGGPWQTTIDSQNYVQLSSAFANQLTNLANAIHLPWGQPAGVSCFGDTILDKAFPGR